ncbi:hypothetical protein D3C78_1189110 [compost metagenome]
MFDHDAFVGGLAHVVDGQRGHAARHHGFHFHARLVAGAAGGLDVDAMRGVVQREVDSHERQRQAVAKRDQFRAALGGQHGGHARGVEHFALALARLRQQAVGHGVHAHAGHGDRHALGVRLGDDVNHAHLAGFVQVAQGRGGR